MDNKVKQIGESPQKKDLTARCGKKVLFEQVELLERSVFNNVFLRDFLNSMHEMVLILNKNRQIVFANTTFMDYVDCSNVSSIVGKRYGEVLFCTVASESPDGCGVSKACHLCESLTSVILALEGKVANREFSIFRGNETSGFVYKITSHPLKVDDESFVFCVLSDIGNLKRRQTLERVFFHDVLNTVNTIYGFASALKDNIPLNTKSTYEKNYNVVRQLIDEIEDQRQLSEAEGGDLQVDPTIINSKELIGHVESLYVGQRLSEDKEIEIDEGFSEVSFTSDRSLVTRVLANMLKNALEAITVGEKVTIGCRANDNGVDFWMHNVGEMPGDVKLQLFNRSFSTKSMGRGWGAYSMKLITEHYLKGKISFTSSGDEGTIFTMSLPSVLRSN